MASLRRRRLRVAIPSRSKVFFRVKTDVPAPKHGARPRGADGAAPSTETEPWFPPRYGFRFGPVLKLARLRGRGLGEAAYNAEGPGPEQKKDLRDGRGGRAKETLRPRGPQVEFSWRREPAQPPSGGSAWLRGS